MLAFGNFHRNASVHRCRRSPGTPDPASRQDADVERERRRVASRAAPRERVLVERPGALVRRRAVFGHRGSSSREERKRSTIDGCERVRAAVTGVRARRVPAGTPQAWHTSHVRCRQAMGPPAVVIHLRAAINGTNGRVAGSVQTARHAEHGSTGARASLVRLEFATKHREGATWFDRSPWLAKAVRPSAPPDCPAGAWSRSSRP